MLCLAGAASAQTTRVISGTIDPNNSTTTPLTGGSTFTGVATDVTQYSSVFIYVFTNTTSSLTTGLNAQFSSDGTNWDESATSTVYANNIYVESIPVRGRYFRVTYTNGATGQSTFRLQSILKTFAQTGDIVDIADTVSVGAHVALNKTSLFGKRADSTYVIGEAASSTDSIPNPKNFVEVGSLGLYWNGVSWDRMIGSSSTGLLTQIKFAASSTPTIIADGATSTPLLNRYGALRVDTTAPVPFNSAGACANVVATTQCLGLSGSGLSYYISNIFVNAAASQVLSITSSATAGNACATSPTTVWGATFIAANGGGPITLPDPIKVTANSALCCSLGGGSASSTCILTGRTAP
jgi:hypothetical protein